MTLGCTGQSVLVPPTETLFKMIQNDYNLIRLYEIWSTNIFLFYISYFILKIFNIRKKEQIPFCPPTIGKRDTPPGCVPRSLTTLPLACNYNSPLSAWTHFNYSFQVRPFLQSFCDYHTELFWKGHNCPPDWKDWFRSNHPKLTHSFDRTSFQEDSICLQGAPMLTVLVQSRHHTLS